MHHCPLKIASVVPLLALVVTTELRGQSGAKVLTPPRAPDTTARTQAGKPSANTIPIAPSPAGTRAPVIVPQTPVLDSIREVVFRNLLERDRSGFGTIASAFCLGLSTEDYKKAGTLADRADPSESMVRRLASPRTPARRASTCTFAPNAAGRPVVGRALLYAVGAIDLDPAGRAEAAAGYNYDGHSAGGFTFSVERADTGWVVKQWRQEWTAKPNAP